VHRMEVAEAIAQEQLRAASNPEADGPASAR
jgi:hypothetical protein